MALRVAAGIWFLFAFVIGSAAVRELLESDIAGAILGVGFGTASAWVGYRLSRHFTRDIAVVAACLAAFFGLLTVAVIARGGVDLFPLGLIVLVLAALGGALPYRERRRT